MGEITVKEEFKVEDGDLSLTLKKQDGEFNYIYISSGMQGAIISKRPDRIIKLLEQLKEKVMV